MALFILSAGGRGFGAWANWDRDDGNAPDGIQNYLGIQSDSNAMGHMRSKVEVADGRMRMFRRMYGDEKTWTGEQKARYSELAGRKQEYVFEYQKMALRYTGNADVARDPALDNLTTGFMLWLSREFLNPPAYAQVPRGEPRAQAPVSHT
ncbi:MAG: hypothetical protein KW806_02670 [Candidatus Yanofskybacteria bacterium]|nr:hypothetical protein [Candidatus Yanofskybacteria bacterium]